MYNFLFYQQFRAALRRVCGKGNPKTPINETVVNQTSETSSRAYVECSFTTFDKKKKSHKDSACQNTSLIDLKNKKLKIIDELTINNNNNIISSNKSSQIFKTPSLTSSETKFPERKAFIFTKSLSRSENNYELRMFSSEANIYGKAINQVIRANSYKSNIC